jgi:hypothetical protein
MAARTLPPASDVSTLRLLSAASGVKRWLIQRMLMALGRLLKR